MGTVSSGADVGRLHELGVRLLGSAEQLDALGDDGSHLLEVLTAHWGGPDLEEVERSWPGIRQSVTGASAVVRDLGEQLRCQAEDQERASSGEGGGAPSGPGAGGPSGLANEEVPGQDASYDEIYGVLDPEIAAAWKTMSDGERAAVLRELTAQLAEQYGIPVPPIQLDPGMHSDTYGQLGLETGTLYLNPDHLDDPRMMLNTVAHEMRHAWQLVASEETNPGWWLGQYGADPGTDRGTLEEATDWAANFDDFDGEDYWNQVVEVDARQSGRDYITGLTPEEFADLVQAAG